jgi:hypothetical protein
MISRLTSFIILFVSPLLLWFGPIAVRNISGFISVEVAAIVPWMILSLLLSSIGYSELKSRGGS